MERRVSAALLPPPRTAEEKVLAVLGVGEPGRRAREEAARKVRLRMRSIDEVRAHLIESFEALGGLVVLNPIVENNTHRPLDIDEFRGFTLHSVTTPLGLREATEIAIL